ncbi:MAG: hypothetical protein K2X87_13810, partial [Gemmataceae bacterium]|nr:hypothetical protein [Gemmataceae bacterium]
MAALFFPSADLLRRVLAGGLVPPAVAASPARARVDAAGRVWVEPAAPLPHPVLDALARVGVRERPTEEPFTEAVRSWAELVPLRPSANRPAGLVLLELPALRLAAVARSVRRRSTARVGVGLVPGDESARAWLTTPLPPDDPDTEAFAEAAPGVWVAAGWEHDLPHLLVPPPGGCLLVRPPRDITSYNEPPPSPAEPDYPITGRPLPAPPASRPAFIRQPLALAPAPTGRESLWVWPVGADGPFRDFCRAAGERELRGLDVAECGGRVVVRRAAGRESAPVPVADPGYWPHPRAAGLFLPAGYDLRPTVRPNVLGRLFDLGPGRVTWVERGSEGRPAIFSVPAASFRSLAAVVEYTVPTAVPLGFDAAAGGSFALAPLPVPLPEVLPVAPEPRPAGPAVRTAVADRPSLVSRSLGWVAGQLRRPPAPPPKPTPPAPKPL